MGILFFSVNSENLSSVTGVCSGAYISESYDKTIQNTFHFMVEMKVIIYTCEGNVKLFNSSWRLKLTPFSFQSGNNSFIALGSIHAPERMCRPKISQ